MTSENAMEGGPGLKHRSDVEILAHLPDPLTNACHVWKIGFSVSLSSSSLSCLGVHCFDTDRTKAGE